MPDCWYNLTGILEFSASPADMVKTMTGKADTKNKYRRQRSFHPLSR